MQDGYRESEQSWHELLTDLKQRGLEQAPLLVTGDGALGFWKAVRKIFPDVTHQRCWVHKTANILDKMPNRYFPFGLSLEPIQARSVAIITRCASPHV